MASRRRGSRPLMAQISEGSDNAACDSRGSVLHRKPTIGSIMRRTPENTITPASSATARRSAAPRSILRDSEGGRWVLAKYRSVGEGATYTECWDTLVTPVKAAACSGWISISSMRRRIRRIIVDLSKRRSGAKTCGKPGCRFVLCTLRQPGPLDRPGPSAQKPWHRGAGRRCVDLLRSCQPSGAVQGLCLERRLRPGDRDAGQDLGV